MNPAEQGPRVPARSAATRLEVVARQPRGSARPTPLVLVHGAWHGAWCWEDFQSYFAERGYASSALNLRGHGNSEGRQRLRWIRAAEYLDDIAQIAEGLPQPPVLIGHSAGGYLLQRYLESRSAAGVVLLASVSSRGALKLFLRMYLRHPLQAAKTNLTLESFHLVGRPGIARETFFSAGVAPEAFDRHFARLQSESYLYGLDMAFRAPRPELARKVPMLVLGAEDDVVISQDEVRETAAAFGTRAELFPGMAHDMMLEKDWQKVAERIAGWLQEHEL